MRISPPAVPGRVLAPLAALSVIAVLDLVASSRWWSLAVVGVLDEPAHLLTAWLVLRAVPELRARSPLPWVLAGAVAIDVDHVPLYLWGALASTPEGRPVTHSLVTVLALAAVAVASRRLRTAATGLCVGVLLHFVRDVATGPGLPLAWPVRVDSVLLPYGVYLGVVAACAVLAAVRTPATDPPAAPGRSAVTAPRRPDTGRR